MFGKRYWQAPGAVSPAKQGEVNVDPLEKRSGGLEIGDGEPKRARLVHNEPNVVSPEQGGQFLRHSQADFSHFDGTNESVPEANVGELPRKATRRPHEPTAQEKPDHEELHEPYREWCAVCVAGRGRAEYSHRANRAEDAIPVFAWDYGYMKKSDGPDSSPDELDLDDDSDSPDQTGGQVSNPILCGRCTSDRWIEGAVLPCKGIDHSYCSDFFDRLPTQDWSSALFSAL